MATKQLIIGGDNSALPSGDVSYASVASGYSWSNAAAYRYQCVSTSGTLNNLYISLSSALTGGSYTICLYQNGNPTSLSVTISSGSSSGSDTTHSVSLSAGDLVCLRCTPSGTSDTPVVYWSSQFTGANTGESLILGCIGCDTATTQYAPILQGYGISSATPADAYQIIPTAGTIKNLYVAMDANPGGGICDYKFTLYQNGSATALTCTIAGTNTTGNDTTHSVSVAAGDYVYLAIVPENSPTNAPDIAIGLTFAASIDGESLILGGSATYYSSGSAQYNRLSNNAFSLSFQTTESIVNQGGHSGFTLKKLYAKIAVAPGAGNGLNLTVRGLSGSTNIVATISDPATTGNDTTHTYSVVDSDLLDIMLTRNVDFNTTQGWYGLVCYQAPTIKTGPLPMYYRP